MSFYSHLPKVFFKLCKFNLNRKKPLYDLGIGSGVACGGKRSEFTSAGQRKGKKELIRQVLSHWRRGLQIAFRLPNRLLGNLLSREPPFPEGLGASTIRLLTTLAWSSVGRAQKVGPQSHIDHRTALTPVGHRGPALQKTRSLRL